MKRESVMQKIKTELMLTDAQKPAFHSTHEGYAVLKEEVDELWDEIKLSKSFDSANLLMVNEAVQVAAMAIKFIENLYRVDSDSDLNFEDSRKLSYASCDKIAQRTYHPF
jgi:hypothetical protein